MTYEFLTGTGQSNRLFYNDMVTDALQYSLGANKARAYFYNKYKNTSNLSGASVTNYDATFGIPGAIAAGDNVVERLWAIS